MSFGAGREGLDGFCDPLGDLGTAVDRARRPGPRSNGRRRARSGSVAVRAATLPGGRDLRGLDARGGASRGRGLRRLRGHDRLLSWKTGKPRAELRRVVRMAELVELLPATGQAWREGTITTTAVELMAGARVTGFDEELVVVEDEFLDRAVRGDHKSLQRLTQH